MIKIILVLRSAAFFAPLLRRSVSKICRLASSASPVGMPEPRNFTGPLPKETFIRCAQSNLHGPGAGLPTPAWTDECHLTGSYGSRSQDTIHDPARHDRNRGDRACDLACRRFCRDQQQ